MRKSIRKRRGDKAKDQENPGLIFMHSDKKHNFHAIKQYYLTPLVKEMLSGLFFLEVYDMMMNIIKRNVKNEILKSIMEEAQVNGIRHSYIVDENDIDGDFVFLNSDLLVSKEILGSPRFLRWEMSAMNEAVSKEVRKYANPDDPADPYIAAYRLVNAVFSSYYKCFYPEH